LKINNVTKKTYDGSNWIIQEYWILKKTSWHISTNWYKIEQHFQKNNCITYTILGQTRPCLLYENIFYFLKSVLRLKTLTYYGNHENTIIIDFIIFRNAPSLANISSSLHHNGSLQDITYSNKQVKINKKFRKYFHKVNRTWYICVTLIKKTKVWSLFRLPHVEVVHT
jgi:hypothetical protein